MTQAVDTPAWGRRNGFIDVGTSASGLSDREVSDRLVILDVVNRYGWSYDERDLDSLERTFTADAVFDGSVAGSVDVGPYEGREAIIEWLKGHMAAQQEQRRHTILNPIFVSQTESTATVNCYLVLTAVADGVARLVTTGFYRFDLVNDDGAWSVRHVFGGFDAAF
ncbi:nuclear transport factor 2 family protein [Gordonia rhizosphera]|uniref:SnoaL-like domain-containing protein n=1 Tax=Gordonia rhizosphera NBRC 16068 TaxID=1108045 RepID=K6WXQ6_9ACTN|nr:nuclear transport factor 2 family protein [Gordonia rhizosphera]GAB91304.1 hypothetical protein GORHZ_126_00450 [Gordonia rhizosphera NBRC 16068]